MAYLLARVRMWAAHHRLAWWSAAGLLAILTGLAVDDAASAPPCPDVAAVVDDRAAPRSGERALALDRGTSRLDLAAGDRVDIYGVDDRTAEGRLLVSAARVLAFDDRTVTVAVPRRDVGTVTVARRWGDVALALVPPAG